MENQSRQLFQLHGSGTHEDQYPWQFFVPKRRHRDSFHSRSFYRIQRHRVVVNNKQHLEFHHCADPQISGNMVHVISRVVLIFQKLERNWTHNVLRQRFSVHSREGKDIEHTFCIRWKTKKPPKDPWTESWLIRPKKENKKVSIYFSRDRSSRVWILTISAASSKSMDRSRSKKQKKKPRRMCINKETLSTRSCKDLSRK